MMGRVQTPSHSKEHGEHKSIGGQKGHRRPPPPEGLRKDIKREGGNVRNAFQWLPLALIR